MDATVKGKWVKALRSGKYAQGRYALNTDGKFCCLGVLCEIARADEGLRLEVKNINEIVIYGDESSFLPRQVAEWAGIDSSGSIPDNFPVEFVNGKGHRDTAYSLMALNDSGATFEDIADIIEEKF